MINVSINLFFCLFGLFALLYFPPKWSKEFNGDFQDGLQLLRPLRIQLLLALLLFTVLYTLRVLGVIDDVVLQRFARPFLLSFLTLPLTLTLSLYHWKRYYHHSSKPSKNFHRITGRRSSPQSSRR